MSHDLGELLKDAAHEPTGLPGTRETWAAGRTRRRVQQLMVAAGTIAMVGVVSLGAVSLSGRTSPAPQIIDRPPQESPTPDPAPRAPDPEAQATDLARLAVASTIALDDGVTLESWLPTGTLVRTIKDGIVYPDRLYGLPNGTVVWQGQQAIHWLGPDDGHPSPLVEASGEHPAVRTHLVGTGDLDGQAVVLVEQSRADSLNDDHGGELVAYRPDGTIQTLMGFPSAWEYGITAATARDGWLLYTTLDSITSTTVLRAPDGTETVIDRTEDGDPTALQSATLADYDVVPGLAVVTHHVNHDTPDAPFGAGRLEIRSVNDPTADTPERVIALPTDNVPKHLVVAGEWAYLTLLPDVDELLQVNLYTGDIDRFITPGVVALHASLQPRHPDAGRPAACADTPDTSETQGQPFVWLHCPDAATYAEGDPADAFFGIHPIRHVDDPKASSSDVAQAIEAMLDAIFAGPTDAERAQGYAPVLTPGIDALNRVSFDDGTVSIDLTEEGARAATIGSTAIMLFVETVQAAVFGGFTEVDTLQFTVDGNCFTWSTYAQALPGCPEFHRTTDDDAD